MTLGWKVRSYRSENGRKIMGKDQKILENRGFSQISQLVLHSSYKKPRSDRTGASCSWSVRPIEIFVKSLYFQGFSGLCPLFFFRFRCDSCGLSTRGSFSCSTKKDVRFIHAERLTEGSTCFIGHIIQGVRPAGSCIPAADPCTLSSIPA